MNLRFIDWIWHVSGSFALVPGQSSGDAFDRLDPLFRQTGTHHQRTNDTLTFTKKDQAAQDKMSVFDGGTLRIDKGVAGSVLRYRLTSRALLFCFLAPILFFSMAQFTIAISKFEKPRHEAAKNHATVALNPLDKMLGAPAPDKQKKKKSNDSEGEDDKLTPIAAYVLSAIFATLYVVGRVIEDRSFKKLLKKSLLEA